MKGALCNLASSGKRYECLLKMVQEEGFEPSSLAALDFKSNVYAIPPHQQIYTRFFMATNHTFAEWKSYSVSLHA